MQHLIDRLIQIELKVKQLALKAERLQQEQYILQKENEQLRNSLRAVQATKGLLEQKLADAQQQINGKDVEDPVKSKQLRKEIDQYIKEIDKCIEWLQNS